MSARKGRYRPSPLLLDAVRKALGTIALQAARPMPLLGGTSEAAELWLLQYCRECAGVDVSVLQETAARWMAKSVWPPTAEQFGALAFAVEREHYGAKPAPPPLPCPIQKPDPLPDSFQQWCRDAATRSSGGWRTVCEVIAELYLAAGTESDAAAIKNGQVSAEAFAHALQCVERKRLAAQSSDVPATSAT